MKRRMAYNDFALTLIYYGNASAKVFPQTFFSINAFELFELVQWYKGGVLCSSLAWIRYLEINFHSSSCHFKAKDSQDDCLLGRQKSLLLHKTPPISETSPGFMQSALSQLGLSMNSINEFFSP